MEIHPGETIQIIALKDGNKTDTKEVKINRNGIIYLNCQNGQGKNKARIIRKINMDGVKING